MISALEELRRILPTSLLDSLDPAYRKALASLIEEKENSLIFYEQQLREANAKVATLTILLQRAHLALKDLCRSQELLGSLPEGIRAQVLSVGDDLLIQEYAEELASPPTTNAVETFRLGPSTVEATMLPKLAIAAAQEVQRQGGVYVSFNPTSVGHKVSGTLVLRANPGWALDRARLQATLLRHAPGSELDVTIHVEVPL